MQKKFQRWLFLLIAGLFLLTFWLSYTVKTRHVRSNGESLIRQKLSEVRALLRRSGRDVAMIRALSMESSLVKARGLALLLESDSEILRERKNLLELLRLLDVDQIHVSDEKGILTKTTVIAQQGYDLASRRQSAEFLPALTNPAFELAQSPMPRGFDNLLFQYTGVARRDRKGVVQIGAYPYRLQRVLDSSDIRSFAETFRFGQGGRILLCENNRILSSGNSAENGELLPCALTSKKFSHHIALWNSCPFDFDISGVPSLCVAETFGPYLILGVLPLSEIYASRNSLLLYLFLSTIVLFGGLFILLTELIQRKVLNGMHSLNTVLEEISKGRLNQRAEVCSCPEFSRMSDGINRTVENLRNAIAAETDRVSADLKFARAAQRASLALPLKEPPNGLEIAGSLRSSPSVRGDFYDFFPLGKHSYAFFIGDVAEVGIAAVLFLLSSKTLIRNLAESGLPPEEVFRRANHQLAVNNSSEIYLTALFGVIDLETGIVRCVNAGHSPPLVNSGVDGHGYRKTDVPPEAVLGGRDGSEYTGREFRMEPGNSLLLYTDGAPNLLNAENELYSEDRLLRFLSGEQICRLSPDELLKRLNLEFDAFLNGTKEKDDLTLLALRYTGMTGNHG